MSKPFALTAFVLLMFASERLIDKAGTFEHTNWVALIFGIGAIFLAYRYATELFDKPAPDSNSDRG